MTVLFLLGALDGKHIRIQCPKLSGSAFFNYKGTFSKVLLAVADADYCFIFVDVGANGSECDGSIFAHSTLGSELEQGMLDLPPPPEDGLSYVFVGDEAFPLKKYLMRPFPGRSMTSDNRSRRLVFNYRLSRARRVVESTFGILVTKWRIFRQPIIADVETVDAIIKATCVLHNFLRRRDGKYSETQWEGGDGPSDHTRTTDDADGTPEHTMTAEGGVEHSWRTMTSEDTGAIPRSGGRSASNNASREAMDLRERFADFFLSPQGAVPWQDRVVQRGQLPEEV